ncbi:MAG: YbaK/EbsC family protein [Acidimicrobiales bacterium]|jgi:prolyl-tRNA editing enzyme YbaK/EbsC (Cys-tRNA(Pro) deacylase)
MHQNAARVQAALLSSGSKAEVVELPDSTRTSAEAAAAIGVAIGQIAKSLVFLADDEPVLAVLSGVDRLDTERLRQHVGAARVVRADASRVRDVTGFPIGGVSPIGNPATLRVVLDKALAAYPVVWAAAGTPHAVFPTTFAELVAITGAETADVREGSLDRAAT